MADGLRRSVVALLGIALVALALLVVGLLLGLIPSGDHYVSGVIVRLEVYETPFDVRALWGAVAFAVFALGVLLMRLAIARERTVGVFVLDEDALLGGGELSIGQRALLALMARSASVEGVRDVTPQLSRRRRGWFAKIDLTLAQDAALPDVAARAEAALRDQLERVTGIAVARVDINGEYALIDRREPLR